MTREVSLGDRTVDYVACTGETVRFWIEFYEENGEEPVNLQGVNAKLFLRRKPTDAEASAELSTDSGGLSVEAFYGRIEVYIPDEDTEDLSGSYVWDLKLEFPSGDDLFLCGGMFTFNQPVTRA